MYKLLCSNLTKSHRSLTNFTGYYRRVARKFYDESVLAAKKHASETDLHSAQAAEEKTEPAEHQDDELPAENESKTRPYSFDDKPIANTSMCPSKKERELRAVLATSVPSRFLHSTSANDKRSDPPLKKPFKSKEAQEYYQAAIEQCMRIKYKLDKFYQRATLAVQPPKFAMEIKRDLENIESSKNIESLKTKTMRQREEKKERSVIPELQKIAHMKSEKDNNQFKQSKFRITYPTHTIRYKLGTYKLQHKIKQQVVCNNEMKTILKSPIKEPMESLRAKHEASSEMIKAEVMGMRYKLHQMRMPYIAHLLRKKGIEDNSEEARQQRKADEAIIRQHPTVRQANESAKMAFKTSYNKLLQKSGLVYQAPTSKDKDWHIGMEQKNDSEKDTERRKNLEVKTPPAAPEPQPWTPAKADELMVKETTAEPKVIEHPLANAKPVKVETSLNNHPKRILSEKSEIFDIDTMCLKKNSASITTNYGDYVVESEERVRNFVEAYKQEPKGQRNEYKTKTETPKDAENELGEESKGVSKVDSISEYLKKLKELRDRTAIDWSRPRRIVEPRKLDIVQRVEGSKIKDVARKFEDEQLDKRSTNIQTRQTDKTLTRHITLAKDQTQTVTEKLKRPKPNIRISIEETGAKNKQYPISDKFVANRDTGLYINKKENASKENLHRRLRSNEEKRKSQSMVNFRREKVPAKRVISLKNIRSGNLSKRVNSRSQSPKDARPIETRVSGSTKPDISEQDDTTHEQKSARDNMKMIMAQYVVQSREAMSMAEIKRINRRKRKERERQLMEEVKTKQKKLEEEETDAMLQGKEAVVEGIERKHKYRLDMAEIETSSVSLLKKDDDTPNAVLDDGNALQVKDNLAMEDKNILNEAPENKSEKADRNNQIQIVKNISKEIGEKGASTTSEEKQSSEKPTSNVKGTRLKTSDNLFTEQKMLKENSAKVPTQVLKEEKGNLGNLVVMAPEEKKLQVIENTGQAASKEADKKETNGLEKDNVSKISSNSNKEKHPSETAENLSGGILKEPKIERNFALEKVTDMKKSFEEKKESLIKLVSTALQQKKQKVSSAQETDSKTTEEKENCVPKESLEKPTSDVKEEHKSEGHFFKMLVSKALRERKVLEDRRKSLLEKSENLEKLVSKVLQHQEKVISKIREKKPVSKISREKENSEKLNNNDINVKEKLQPSETNIKKFANIKPTEQDVSESDWKGTLEKVTFQRKAVIETKEKLKTSYSKVPDYKEMQGLKEKENVAIKELSKGVKFGLEQDKHQKTPILKIDENKPVNKISTEKETSEKHTNNDVNVKKKYANIKPTEQKVSESNFKDTLEKVANQRKAIIEMKEELKTSFSRVLEEETEVLKEKENVAIKELSKGVKVGLEKNTGAVPAEKIQHDTEKISNSNPNPKIAEDNLKINLPTETKNESLLNAKPHGEQKASDTVKADSEPVKKKPKEKWPGGFKVFKQRIADRKMAAKNESQPSENIKTVGSEKLKKELLFKTQLENLKKLKDASTKIVKLVENIDIKLETEAKGEKSTAPDNRPTIRKERPEPKKEKQKREHPRSKTDIVLPPKGHNDPKMQRKSSESSCFEEIKRDIIAEINKELKKNAPQRYKLVSLEQTKKCKSLADLASEQKAKILREIEVTWNEEKAKAKRKYKISSKSETRLSAKEETKELKMADTAKENTEQKKKWPILIIKLRYPSSNTTPSGDKTKMVTHQNPQKSKDVDDELKDKAPEHGNKFPRPEGIQTFAVHSIKILPEHQPQNTTKDKELTFSLKETAGCSQSDKPQTSPSSFCFPRMRRARIEEDVPKRNETPQNIVGFVPKDVLWHTPKDLDLCLSKLKRGRIEDDHMNRLAHNFVKHVEKAPRSKSVDSRRRGNLLEKTKSSQALLPNATPSLQEIKWNGTHEANRFCFDRWKREELSHAWRIESISKNVPIQKKNISKDSGNATSLVNITDQSSKIGRGIVEKIETKPQNLEKMVDTPSKITKQTKETTVCSIKPKRLKLPVKKKHVRNGGDEANRFGFDRWKREELGHAWKTKSISKDVAPTQKKTPSKDSVETKSLITITDQAGKIGQEIVEKIGTKLQNHEKMVEPPGKITKQTKESTVSSVKPKRLKVPVKKKHVRSASRTESKECQSPKTMGEKSKSALVLTGGRLLKNKLAPSTENKSAKKHVKVEKAKDPKIPVNTDSKTKNNIRKLIEAMKKADRELEEILRTYQIYKKPVINVSEQEGSESKIKEQGATLKRELTQVVDKKTKTKLYKNSIDSKTYVVGDNECSKRVKEMEKNKSEVSLGSSIRKIKVFNNKSKANAKSKIWENKDHIKKEAKQSPETTKTSNKHHNYLLPTNNYQLTNKTNNTKTTLSTSRDVKRQSSQKTKTEENKPQDKEIGDAAKTSITVETAEEKLPTEKNKMIVTDREKLTAKTAHVAKQTFPTENKGSAVMNKEKLTSEILNHFKVGEKYAANKVCNEPMGKDSKGPDIDRNGTPHNEEADTSQETPDNKLLLRLFDKETSENKIVVTCSNNAPEDGGATGNLEEIKEKGDGDVEIPGKRKTNICVATAREPQVSMSKDISHDTFTPKKLRFTKTNRERNVSALSEIKEEDEEPLILGKSQFTEITEEDVTPLQLTDIDRPLETKKVCSNSKRVQRKARFSFSRSILIDLFTKPNRKIVNTIFINKSITKTPQRESTLNLETRNTPRKKLDAKNANAVNFKLQKQKRKDAYLSKSNNKTEELKYKSVQKKPKNKHKTRSSQSLIPVNGTTKNLAADRDAEGKILLVENSMSNDETPTADTFVDLNRHEVQELSRSIRENISRTKYMLEKQLAVLKAVKVPQKKSKIPLEETLQLDKRSDIRYGGNKDNKTVELLDKKVTQEVGKMLVQDKFKQGLENEDIPEGSKDLPCQQTQQINDRNRENKDKTLGGMNTKTEIKNQDTKHVSERFSPYGSKVEGTKQDKDTWFQDSYGTTHTLQTNCFHKAYRKVKHILSLVRKENENLKQTILTERNKIVDQKEKQIGEKKSEEFQLIYSSHILQQDKESGKVKQNEKENVTLEETNTQNDQILRGNKLEEIKNQNISVEKLDTTACTKKSNKLNDTKDMQKKSTHNKVMKLIEIGLNDKSQTANKFEERRVEEGRVEQKRTEQNCDDQKLRQYQLDETTRVVKKIKEINKKLGKKKHGEEDQSLTNIRRSAGNIKTAEVGKQDLTLKKQENKEKIEKSKQKVQKMVKPDRKLEKSLTLPKQEDAAKQEKGYKATQKSQGIRHKLTTNKVQSYVELASYKIQSNAKNDVLKEKRLKSTTEPCLTKFNSKPSKTETKPNDKIEYTYTSERIKQVSVNRNEDLDKIQPVKESNKIMRNEPDKDNTLGLDPHLKKRHKTVTENVKNKNYLAHKKIIPQESKNKAFQVTDHFKTRTKKSQRIKTTSKIISTVRLAQQEKETQTQKLVVERSDINQGTMYTSQTNTPEYGSLSHNSWYEVKDHMYIEAKMRQVFDFYLSNREYYKNKYSKNRTDDIKQDSDGLSTKILDNRSSQTLSTPLQNVNSDIHLIPSAPIQKEKETETTKSSKSQKIQADKNDFNIPPEYAIQLQKKKEDNDIRQIKTNKTSETIDSHLEHRTMELKPTKVESKALVPIHSGQVSDVSKTPENQIRKFASEKVDYNEFKYGKTGPLKAKIEEIFTKQYRAEDKIQRFNKNLLKHVQQRCENLPQEAQKQGVITASKTLLDPRMLDVYDMQKTLYKFLGTELRKPYHERSTGFSLLKKYNRCKSPACYCTDKEEQSSGEQGNEERKGVQQKRYYIEKSPPNRYKEEKSEEPPKPVARSCDRLCLPLKNLSQVALKPPIEETTTLNKGQTEKIHVVPKTAVNVLDKYKGLKITQFNINRHRRRTDESFLPMVFGLMNKNDPKKPEATESFEETRKQILEFRYELLRKLHKEFSAMSQKDLNKNVGRFEKVLQYYKSVTETLKKEKEGETVLKFQSKSMEELVGPCLKPSFDNVSRYYNSIIVKDKVATKESNDNKKEVDAEATGDEKSNTKKLIQKLSDETTGLDKSRNDGTRKLLTKDMKKDDDKGNNPKTSGSQN